MAINSSTNHPHSHAQFFALYREYTARYALNPNSSQLNISDICILMAIQSQCILSLKDKNDKESETTSSVTDQNPLHGVCQKPLSYFEEQFFLSRSTVRRSLEKLQSPEFNLIKITNNNKYSKSTQPTIKLLQDFSKSSSIVTDQNPNLADEYTGKSTFIKIYINTFDPKFLNGRDLSTTDILIYNIIYSYIYNDKYNKEKVFKRSLSDISIYLPIGRTTMWRSLENLKRYDLISKTTTEKKEEDSSIQIKIITDITKEPAEEFFEF